jgi:hypothetical protein
VILPLALLIAQAGADRAPLGIAADPVPVVETYQGAEITQVFVLRNLGTRPFRVRAITPSTPDGAVESVPTEPIPPGGHAEVTVRQGTSGRLGFGSFRYLLTADDGLPERRLVLSVFVQSAFDPERPLLSGDTSPGGVVETTLASRLVERLSVADISGVPGFLTAAALPGPDGSIVLRATVAADAPHGRQSGELRLRTNVPTQPEIVVPYQLNLFGDVVPETPSVDLGTVRQGQPFEKSLRLRSRSSRPLAVSAVEGAGPGVAVSVAECAEPDPSCRLLVFKGTGGEPGAPLSGSVRVSLGEGRPITIPYSCLVFRADATVRDLGSLDAVAAAAAPAPAPTPPPVPPPVTGKPGERRARLVWDASQEEQTFGYLIYRALRREGPFLRLNARVVPVGRGPAPRHYTYEDDTVTPGRSYYYYLESVSNAGIKARLSGVVTKVIPPAP